MQLAFLTVQSVKVNVHGDGTHKVNLEVVADNFLWCFGADTHQSICRSQTQVDISV